MLLSVSGFPSTKTVQIRIYNFTTSTEVVAWTATGVSERADGQGYSTYYYNYALVAGSEYIVDWKDNSTPVNTASESFSTLQSGVASIVAKLPFKDYLTGTNNESGDLEMQDTTGGFNTTQLEDIGIEVAEELNTAIPASPTSDSLNERVKAIDNKLPNDYIMGSSVQTSKDDEIDDIKTETLTHPTLAEIEASAVLAKEATLATIAGYIDTEITTIINAIAALQTDLGDPSADATTIYAQLLLVKGYVDDLESRLTATRAGYLDNLSGGAVALNATVTHVTYGLSALKTLIDTIDDYIDTEIAAIKAQTDKLTFDTSNNVAATISGSGANTVTITVNDGTDPLADVSVRIHNSNNDATPIIAAGTSSALGVVTVYLANGTYKVRMMKAGYTFTTPETLVVSGTSSDTYSGTIVSVGAPGSSYTCRIYEYLYNADDSTKPSSTPVNSCRIVELPYDYQTKLHLGTDITATYSSATGLIYWDVVYGSVVEIYIKDFYGKKRRTVPASTTVRLSDITS